MLGRWVGGCGSALQVLQPKLLVPWRPAGGISVTLVGHPFDTLKVRLQTQPADKPIYCGYADAEPSVLGFEQRAYEPPAGPWAPLMNSLHPCLCSGCSRLCAQDDSMGGLRRVVQGAPCQHDTLGGLFALQHRAEGSPPPPYACLLDPARLPRPMGGAHVH